MGEQVAARSLKKRDRQGRKHRKETCTLKTAHRRVFHIRKTTSDFYDEKKIKKELIFSQKSRSKDKEAEWNLTLGGKGGSRPEKGRRQKVKQSRAQGGCLGTESRRKT